MAQFTRRNVLFGAAAALSSSPAAAARLPIRKGVLLSMLPKELSPLDKMKLALDCGFQSLECGTVTDPKEADAIQAASAATKLPIHSVMNMAHWKFPLSSPDPAVVAESVKGMRASLENAKLWGAETVLLVPAVVNNETSYADAWKRSQAEIRKLLPYAAELKVTIAIENVWNKFLLSPLEMVRYVDEINHPRLKAYLDVGNMVLFGFPQDWIRTLGPRIAKVHLKDFSFRKRVAEFTALREGDIDWKAVHAALAAVGYKGDATVELNGGDAAYLKEVSRRVDLILEGA
jgi:hexulose-6-phosphate isomerase